MKETLGNPLASSTMGSHSKDNGQGDWLLLP